MYGFTESSVSHYVQAYKIDGESSLLYRKRGRKPQTCSKLPAKDELDIQGAICKKTPDVLGLPNLEVHHAKKIAEWLHANIGIFFLPPYCPEMNPQQLVNQEPLNYNNLSPE